MACKSLPLGSVVEQQQQRHAGYRVNLRLYSSATTGGRLQPRACGLLGRPKHIFPPVLSATRAPSRSALADESYRTQASVQQRHGAATDSPQHHSQHSNSHSHQPVRSTSDDSVRIIMLLSLSLMLMLLPWMSRHPEFLIAPLLLAVTPVVGNGARSVLKEVGTGLLTTVRLSFGVLAHHEQQHDHHHHHHHGQQQHYQQAHNAHRHQHNHQQPTAASSPWPNPHMQQQQHRAAHQHQQHPRPAGPYSPWPNPSRTPAPWPPAGPAPAAASMTGMSGATTPIMNEKDSDWSPVGPRDPHHADPHSQQHLQQVLAADQQVEQELGRPGVAAAAGQSSKTSGSPSRSPAGSPVNSFDGAVIDQSQHAGTAPAAAAGAHPQPHHHHVRDPRVLSKEAKQQLYHNHQHH